MAIDLSDIQEAIKDTLVVSGVAGPLAEGISERAARRGAKRFWRANFWTFSRGYEEKTLSSGSTAAIDAPTDATAIFGIVPNNSNDRGTQIELLPEHMFNSYFPNLDAMNSSDVWYAKVYREAGELKIQFAPPPTYDATLGIIFKYNYDESRVEELVPEDFAPVIEACGIYSALAAGAANRMSMYQEMKDMLEEAKRGDKAMVTRLGQVVKTNPQLIDNSRWDWGDRYGIY